MTLPSDFNPDFPGLAEVLATSDPSVAIRLNSAKMPVSDVGGEQVPWCESGRYLSQRPDFTFDPALHQGCYYVQDASSMIYHHIGRYLSKIYSREVAVLDACAAPGGKTTALIDAFMPGSLIVANEYVPARAEVLHENIVKWGSPDVVVSRGDTSRFLRLGGMFDVIAADVPCSGEGMFRKDADAITQWSPRLVNECAALQREIIGNLWPALAPGGYLIYSTCTFNRAENEDNVEWIVNNLPGASIVEIPGSDDWNLVRRDGVLHFLPGNIRGEGLTVALLHKASDTHVDIIRRSEKKNVRKNVCPDRELLEWISDENYTLQVVGDRVYACPDRWKTEIDTLARELTLPWNAGVEVAAMKGRDYIPSHALAVNKLLRRGSFYELEIGYADAIAYLRRETIVLPSGTPRGFVLLTYAGRPLGFVKNIGNRANNLYPQSWRILSSHIPLSQPSIVQL